MIARFKLLLMVSLIYLAGVSAVQDRLTRSQAAQKPSVEELIGRLKSRNFKKREEATRALIERDDALKALQRALQADDLELRLRAKRILEEKDRLGRQERLRRLPDLIKNGEVDSFVDLMCSLEDSIHEETWQAVSALATRIVVAAGKKLRPPGEFAIPYNGSPDNFKFKFNRTYNLKTFPKRESICGMRDVIPEVAVRDDLRSCFFVSRGRVLAKKWGIDNSIIFANGDVIASGLGGFRCCLIVCDGSIKGDFTTGSILIATGSITLDSGGGISIPNCREALGLLKFYDTKQAGIEASEVSGRVVVKSVLEGKPFAKAGIRPGDRILAIDGVKIAKYPDFRRLVRRNAVLGKETVFTVERPGKGKRDVAVKFAY